MSTAPSSLFVQGSSPSSRILLAAVLAIGIIVADHRYEHLVVLRSALSVIVYPVYYLDSLPDTLIRKVGGQLATEEELRRHNRSLYRDNLVLKGRLQQLEALKAENVRLRDLLGSSLKISDQMLIAELMAVG